MLRSHPLVYELVYMLHKEQKMVEDAIVRIRTGVLTKRRPQYIMRDERIKREVDDYDKFKDFYDYFGSLSLIWK